MSEPALPPSGTVADDITDRTLAAAQSVLETLGAGFTREVYAGALAVELKSRGLFVEARRAIAVRYHGEIVGEYTADLLVERSILVEVSAGDTIPADEMTRAQNVLKATGMRVGLLLGFGAKLLIRRQMNRHSPTRQMPSA